MLINCVADEAGRKLGDIPVEAISDYLAQPGGFVWVALKDARDDDLTRMQEESGLHELAVEDARHGHQRPKIEEYDDSLFAVVQLVELVDGELQLGEVDVFVGRNYVLSVRSRSAQHFLGVRSRCEREPHLLKLEKGAARANIQDLYALKRKAMVMKHAVAPLMKAPPSSPPAGCRRCAPTAPPTCGMSMTTWRAAMLPWRLSATPSAPPSR
jgi:magnesium transporter